MARLDKFQVDTILSVVVTLSVILLDRLSKIFFTERLLLGESIQIIPNILDFTLVYNTGIAFGFFKDQGIVFIIVPIVAIVLLVYNIFYYKYHEEGLKRGYILGFSLILGGAVGNLIDRIMYGHVIDFINFHFWPVFNVADSAITIGAVFVAFKCLQVSKGH